MAESVERILILLHDDDAGPGNLAAWLDERRIPWELADVRREPLPPVSHRRALVVLGSRESAYDRTVPWLDAEREFVAATAATGTPVLGLCFGGQLLAQVMGGSVAAAEEMERGWTAVRATSGAGQDAELFGRTWLAWHYDNITPPPDATVLARSDRCVQAFTIGPHLGLQFHPEATGTEIRAWRISDSDLPEDSPETLELMRLTERHEADAREAAGRLYAYFLAGLERTSA
ncbi:type 1 glutamine amidotransferase [Pseudonocardia spinosispora]|uniref:type 1 glutamine amidotransferase n=1 Tax=Pseudonocardia spinosispora TaxID=103441 RepID=UPI000410188A|nr:type 1 glutamine amidotransferase [Pseudonocardia spinosispora]